MLKKVTCIFRVGRENHRLTPSAQGRREDSVCLVLIKNRTCLLPLARYVVSRLNGSRGPDSRNFMLDLDQNK